MSFGSMALTVAVFTLSATTSENFDSCSTSVSYHCIFTFLVRFVDVSLAIDAACSTTERGLNLCVTACQAWSPSPGLTLRTLLTSVATSPRVHVIRAAAIGPPSCWTSQKVLSKIATELSSNFSSFGDFSQQRTTLSIARQDCRTVLHPKRKDTVVELASTELLRQVSHSLWFSFLSYCGPGFDTAVVVRAKRSRSALHSVCTWPFTASSSSPNERVPRGRLPWAPLPSWWNMTMGARCLNLSMQWSCGVVRKSRHTSQALATMACLKHSNFHKLFQNLDRQTRVHPWPFFFTLLFGS